MTATHDPALCAKLIATARDDRLVRVGSTLSMTEQLSEERALTRALADQLEAAGELRARCENLEKILGTERDAGNLRTRILVANAERDKLRAELEAASRVIDARDAIIAADQRTIDSGNEAFSTMRAQWHGERAKLQAEVDRLAALSDLRGRTVADLADELGSVKAQRYQLQVELEAARRATTERDLMRPVVEAAETSFEEAHQPDEDGPPIDCECSVCSAVRVYRAARKAGKGPAS